MGIENCDKLLNEPGKGDPNWAQACKPYAPPCPLCDSKDAVLARQSAALKMAVDAMDKSARRCRACFGEGSLLVNDDDPMGGGMTCPECAGLRAALATCPNAAQHWRPR